MVEMFPVESTRITHCGYDEGSATVHVQFMDGKRWAYRGVPKHVWTQFLRSDSKGRFIHDVLNGYEHGPA